MKFWNPKDIAALLMCITLCMLLILWGLSMFLHPDAMTDKGREVLGDTISFNNRSFLSGYIFLEKLEKQNPQTQSNKNEQ